MGCYWSGGRDVRDTLSLSESLQVVPALFNNLKIQVCRQEENLGTVAVALASKEGRKERSI